MGNAALAFRTTPSPTVHMLYLVTVTVRDSRKPGDFSATRTYSFHVANFHNAEAIQAAFQDVATVDVHFEPDVFAYLRKDVTKISSPSHRKAPESTLVQLSTLNV